jgi:hypothetical protein
MLFLCFLEKPRFVVNPRNVSVFVHLKATMNCTAVGYPRPNITWYKNKSPIIKGKRVFAVTNGNTSVLMVTYVTRQDQGAYSCRAENYLGVYYSVQAFLDVIVPGNI